MGLATNLDLTFRWLKSTALDLVSAQEQPTGGRVDWSDALSDGTGAVDTGDLVWSDRRSLASTTESLDLAGGLTDSFGAAITFARIKMIAIKNNNTSVGHNLIIGGAASNQFLLFTDSSDKYTLGPNGVFLVWEPSAAAKAVTASTGDLLKIDSGSNTVSYDIIIIGSSA